MFRSWLYTLLVLAAMGGAGLALGPLPVAAQVPVCEQTYIVAPGDHLSRIAEQFYGDRNRWPIIYDATNAMARTDPSFATIGNPSLVIAGQKLCIPALSAAGAPPVAAATTGRLTLEVLKNATYVGIYEQPVTLKDGLYEGEPFVADSPMRPTVTLVDRLIAYGDLNGDGVEDAAVILMENSGGSGVFNYVAPVLNVGGMPVNPAVQALGDRVQIKRMDIEDGQIVTEIVTQGPDDPFCCPTLLLLQTFRLQDNRLSEATRQELGTVSYQDLDGTAWLLAEMAFGQPVLAGSTITLLFSGDRISGSTGCNTYSATVIPGDVQELTIGPALSTRMACLDPRLTEHEALFLELLSGVRSWGYLAGHLALNYSVGERVGSLLAAPQPVASPAGATPTAQPTAAATPSSATVTATQVITYAPVAVPGGETRPGSCWANSLAAGGREDAWRCTSDNAISDPCFEVAGERSVVVCEPDPTKDDPGFALKLTLPLPQPDVPAAAKEAYANNGWLLTLADGTVCGFATGATTGVDDKRANYLCAGTEWVILGDLQPGVVWQAEMALITIGDDGPQLQQSKMVAVRTLWR
jgi:heat shock protein HslJ